MDDLRALLIGVFSGLAVVGIAWGLKAWWKRSIRDDIEIAEYEKNLLEGMKKSSVEMNRSAFRAIFTMFVFISAANLIPRSIDFISSGIDGLSKIGGLSEIIFWSATALLAIKLSSRYNNLKNHKEASKNLDEKINRLKSKL